MLKLEKFQYENSIFQLNYRKYEKKVIIQNCLLQKDLQFESQHFFIRCIFIFLNKKNTIKNQVQFFNQNM